MLTVLATAVPAFVCTVLSVNEPEYNGITGIAEPTLTMAVDVPVTVTVAVETADTTEVIE
jgi:hypothetical protein